MKDIISGTVSSRLLQIVLFCLVALSLPGCATRQEVKIIKASSATIVKTAVQMPEVDNSAEMNSYLRDALEAEGIVLRGQNQAGNQRANEVDAVISYIDVWRWDLIMYLKQLTVRVYEPKSGDLVAEGTWEELGPHGFRNAKTIMEGLVKDVVVRVKAIAKSKS